MIVIMLWNGYNNVMNNCNNDKTLKSSAQKQHNWAKPSFEKTAKKCFELVAKQGG